MKYSMLFKNYVLILNDFNRLEDCHFTKKKKNVSGVRWEVFALQNFEFIIYRICFF